MLASVPVKPSPETPEQSEEACHSISPDEFVKAAEDAGLVVTKRLGQTCAQEFFHVTRNPATSSGSTEESNGSGATAAGADTLHENSLTDVMLKLNQTAAVQHSVESAVHPQDFIYYFLCTHPLLSLTGAIDYYFQDGATSARKLIDLVDGFGDLRRRPVKLLEFASGYGCVSRHLKKFGHIDVVSCDIHPEAIRFLADQIGVKTLLSAHVPEQFSTSEKFDVVFALSFFSHMPKTTFARWLRSLFETLDSPGYLIFTTRGLRACQDDGITEDDIPADGFWFVNRSEQHDLDTEEYGLTIVTPEFVKNVVRSETGATIVAYKYVGWWDNQDLWVIKREK